MTLHQYRRWYEHVGERPPHRAGLVIETYGWCPKHDGLYLWCDCKRKSNDTTDHKDESLPRRTGSYS